MELVMLCVNQEEQEFAGKTNFQFFPLVVGVCSPGCITFNNLAEFCPNKFSHPKNFALPAAP